MMAKNSLSLLGGGTVEEPGKIRQQKRGGGLSVVTIVWGKWAQGGVRSAPTKDIRFLTAFGGGIIIYGAIREVPGKGMRT